MPRKKLTPAERRAIVLEALNGANKLRLAERHGIVRSWLYNLVDEALEDPEGKLEEAEAEAEFRRRVWEWASGRTRPPSPDATDHPN